jgi:hypothetical protein
LGEWKREGNNLKKLLLSVVAGIVLSIGSAHGEVVVQVRPPKVIVEHRGVAPSHGHVWIAGYHRWDGHAYVWEKGHWELPPREHAVWVGPRWRHRHDGWVFVEGRWR